MLTIHTQIKYVYGNRTVRLQIWNNCYYWNSIENVCYRPILHWVGPLVAFLTNGFFVKFAMAFAINALFSPSISILSENDFNNFLTIGKYIPCKVFRIFETLTLELFCIEINYNVFNQSQPCMISSADFMTSWFSWRHESEALAKT